MTGNSQSQALSTRRPVLSRKGPGPTLTLNQLLRDDYRGIMVTMIRKFRAMPADLNTRSNIYVLIDEAHRTTGGDLGRRGMTVIEYKNANNDEAVLADRLEFP